MDSPSRSRKRRSKGQLDNQIENSEPGNAKRSKASLECILEPIRADEPEQQNRGRVMIAGQPLQEEELSRTVVHESVGRQDSQTPVNGDTGQGPAINNHNMSTVPISTGKEDQGMGLGRQPDFPVVMTNQNGLYTPARLVGNQALQDYQLQVMILDQQNQKRLMIEKKTLKDQDTIIRTITSLPDQLNIAHTSVKELLKRLPDSFHTIEDFRCSIARDIKTLPGYEEKLDKKESEIIAVENRYNELIQMTPEAQQGELRQVRDKALLTMQQDRENLRLNRDNTVKKVEEKNGRIKGLEVALVRSRELVPELIEDLIKLTPKLHDPRANGQF